MHVFIIPHPAQSWGISSIHCELHQLLVAAGSARRLICQAEAEAAAWLVAWVHG